MRFLTWALHRLQMFIQRHLHLQLVVGGLDSRQVEDFLAVDLVEAEVGVGNC